jgi:hypothetical protein
MLKDKLTFIIHSCDKFSDLWDAHIELLNKNWADRNIDTYLVTDSPTDKKYDKVEILAAGEGKEITERIKFALPEIKTEYVLVSLDDYFDIYPISNAKIEKLVNIMEEDDLDYICIFKNPKNKEKYKNHKNMYISNLHQNYSVNLYPGIWRKDFMEKTIRETLNAWQYEVTLTHIAREVGARCVQSKNKEFPIMDVVRKGKILRKANKYLKKHNLYHGDRPVRTVKEEATLGIITFVRDMLPKPLLNFIKKTFKIKTFSGTN